MKSVELSRSLASSFSDRSAFRLNRERDVVSVPHGEQRVFIVLDLAVSRQLLTARTFSSFNYFQEGIEWLEATGRSMRFLKHFFDQGLLFKEGQEHRSTKHEHMKLLDVQCRELEKLLPSLESFFGKRRRLAGDALTFSRLFVRLCTGISMSRLTSVPLRAAMRAAHRRENIFYYHFHPARHRRMEAVLRDLFGSIPGEGEHCSETAWLLAVSLLVMGHDPLVGSLCAALIDDEREDLTRAPQRYCPTSFVPRVCMQETTIAGHRLAPGDICYVSLVRSREDAGDRAAFPFGLGVHTCAGKRYSDVVLRLADEVAGRCFPDGFNSRCRAYGDGAFLTFSNLGASH